MRFYTSALYKQVNLKGEDHDNFANQPFAPV